MESIVKFQPVSLNLSDEEAVSGSIPDAVKKEGVRVVNATAKPFVPNQGYDTSKEKGILEKQR